MRLYMVTPHWRQLPVFYWARDENEAIDQYISDGGDKDEPVRADMVWAENQDASLRGYVIKV